MQFRVLGLSASGRWIAAFAVMFLLCSSLQSLKAETVAPPSGWSEKMEGQIRVVSRGELTIRIGPWYNLEGQSLLDWTSAQAADTPPGTTLRSSDKPTFDDKTGAYTIARKLMIGDRQGQSSLGGCPGNEGTARTIELFGSNQAMVNFLDLIPGANFMEQVCLEEKGGAVAVLSPDTTSETRTAAPPADTKSERPVSSPLPPASAPDGFETLRGVIVMGIQPGGMFGTTDMTIATFEDGTYTDDLHTAFNDGVTASKAENPKDWGQWRQDGDQFMMKGSRDDEFDTTRGDWTATPGTDDQRLEGCFGKLDSTSGADYGGGTTVGKASTWCFSSDGRFTHSSTAFGSSSEAVMSSTSPTMRGRYRVDGYAARFVYDDGREVLGAFSFLNDDLTHIGLNGKRFMGAN